MTTAFDKLIKELTRETIELKTVRRLATTTIDTATKSIAAAGVIRKQTHSSGTGTTVFTKRAALITIGTPDDSAAPFSVSLTNEEVRNYRIFGASSNSQAAIIVAPAYTNALDAGMAMGDKTVNFTVNITSTDEISLTYTQIDFEEGA